MISVILIEPENPGNVGAVARVMANFDFKNLVLINPKCVPEDQDARNRAKHSQNILKDAVVAGFEYLDKFDYLIATTSKLGNDYNIPRSPITPDELATLITGNMANIGIVFGREGIGLTNDEIAMCDYVVSIPTSKRYPALNLSHSTAIVLYELYKAIGEKKITEHFIAASRAEKEQMTKMLHKILDKMHFATKEKKMTQKIVWKKIFGKAMLTRREAFAVMGFFKKLA